MSLASPRTPSSAIRPLPRLPSQRKGKVPPPLPSIPVSLNPMREGEPLTPTQSPVRTCSFTQVYGDTPGQLSPGIRRSNFKLPRLMVVTSVFEPAMKDELLIKLGETLTMLEEYEDEWCLVRRHDRVMGMIPCFCLSEPPKSTTSPQFSP
ncbi:hypothetical protein SERLA73DRAFT_186979 [Serpula lacrymans var. lacrymans S7.3]|uniref:SH3 domain-containing protein n=2 Tax=Serpula lacrymans var. lacrymans TaxID=341189 RepID=F8Q876_SERL3|nr:uncharacterized protein SERLADRAFT_476291 [Serpula lacrymans var. lacrymans S7.9]EGN95764.1 hypothetical protein SERLA73DRAFT_186979 [Serpula lacrymans var. lacrymans S7.3]EGO21288.1 hypothetical protein SERLADRAFT_476291 [Serpula lacrymans var. lacrymans S7.9]